MQELTVIAAIGLRVLRVSSALISEVPLGTVIQFRRPVASAEVIGNLVKLGYLQPADRYEANAIEAAVARLRHDLSRDGVICERDLPQEEGKGSRCDARDP